MANRLRSFAGQKIVERKPLRFATACVQLHGLAHKDAPRKNRQNAPLAVRKLVASCLCRELDVSTTIRYRNPELERP